MSGLLLLLLLAASVVVPVAVAAARCCASFRLGLRRQMYLLWLVARLQQRHDMQGTIDVSGKVRGSYILLRSAAASLYLRRCLSNSWPGASLPSASSVFHRPRSCGCRHAQWGDQTVSRRHQRVIQQRAQAPHLRLTSGSKLLDVDHPWQLCAAGQLLLMLHTSVATAATAVAAVACRAVCPGWRCSYSISMNDKYICTGFSR